MGEIYGFVGLGLIGGSIAKAIKKIQKDSYIITYEHHKNNKSISLLAAKKDNIIDQITDSFEDFSPCSIIFLCAPVLSNISYLQQLKNFISSDCIITDVGSVKNNICEAALSLQLHKNFIGGHPMAGSEKTGYENATDHLLENAYYIITPTPLSGHDAVNRMVAVAKTIGSIPIVLDYQEHDRIVAAISHLPHIIASSLVNLVKDSDNHEELMKRLAAGGFKDITRIASASPIMWEQICMSNADNIIQTLEDYIASLENTLQELKCHNSQAIRHLFDTSRTYRNAISDIGKGSVTPEYSFTVDVVDEPGAISTLAVILSARGISINNIGINHNREHGEGALKITFYDEAAMDAAWKQLKKYNYELIKSQ